MAAFFFNVHVRNLQICCLFCFAVKFLSKKLRGLALISYTYRSPEKAWERIAKKHQQINSKTDFKRLCSWSNKSWVALVSTSEAPRDSCTLTWRQIPRSQRPENRRRPVVGLWWSSVDLAGSGADMCLDSLKAWTCKTGWKDLKRSPCHALLRRWLFKKAYRENGHRGPRRTGLEDEARLCSETLMRTAARS